MGYGAKNKVCPVQVGAVVVGFDRHLNYYKIQYATLCISENPGCHFIATNLDARTHLTDAQEWAGNGAMVGAIKGRCLACIQNSHVLTRRGARVIVGAIKIACRALRIYWHRLGRCMNHGGRHLMCLACTQSFTCIDWEGAWVPLQAPGMHAEFTYTDWEGA